MADRSLTEISNLHGTDKGTVGPTDHWPAHNYTDIYEAYFDTHRSASVTILEIGLGVTGDRWIAAIVRGRNQNGGASLRTWYDYFPLATIYGIDVNSASHLDNERIHTFIADQGNLDDLRTFSAATEGIVFDFIIDDGSHRPEHQQVSLGFLFKYLKDGGLYFIEDSGRVNVRETTGFRVY